MPEPYHWTPLPIEGASYREVAPGTWALIVETPYGEFGFEIPKARAERIAAQMLRDARS